MSGLRDNKETHVRTIKAGLIGYGLAGEIFHAPILTSVPGVELYAIASRQTDKVRAHWPAARIYSDSVALLADPQVELAVIATPNQTHYPLALAALRANKHVVIDKPFTTNSIEAQELIVLAHARSRLLSVYHNRRWDGDFLTVQRLLAENRLGRIVSFESRFDRFRPIPKQHWREENIPGSGLLFDIGPHLIDQALVLFGQPQALCAELARQRDKAQAVDFFQLVLHYAHLRVQLSASQLVKTAAPRFILHGTHGSYIKYGLDPQEDMLKEGETPLSPQWGIDFSAGFLNIEQDGYTAQQEITNLPGCYEAYYHGIAQALRENTPPPVSAEAGLAAITLIETALQSAAEKRVIRLQ